ncbi:hypothetical protein LEP1GSC073_0547 [Leptospira noguchii str. Cascata]|nr:hypothetical protein LEP1GSC073_0547 [Leptospira noguchii str. Cascata]
MIKENKDLLLRMGRHIRNSPENQLQRSAPRINKVAICTTLSRIVGIPNGRSFPFDFGIYTRFIGLGRYVFSWSSFCSCRRKPKWPISNDSISSILTPSIPALPPFRFTLWYAQNKVGSIDSVIQRVESIFWFLLRFLIELRSQGYKFLG